jgi:hypothetical protein
MKLECHVCGKKFSYGLRLFDPETGEPIDVCGGECSSEVIRLNRMACKHCDQPTLSAFALIDPLHDRTCGNCKRF